MNHTSFYLAGPIPNALDLRSARQRARAAGVVDYSIEVSRGRGSRSQTWSVICSADVARFLVAELEQLAAPDPEFARQREGAIATIRSALAAAAAPMTASVESHAPAAPRIGM